MKLDYKEASLLINKISSEDNKSGAYVDGLAMLNQLKESKLKYAKGKEYEEAADYKLAFENYSAVIEEDSKYQDARSHVSTCKEFYINDTLKSLKKSMEAEDYVKAQSIINEASSIANETVIKESFADAKVKIEEKAKEQEQKDIADAQVGDLN